MDQNYTLLSEKDYMRCSVSHQGRSHGRWKTVLGDQDKVTVHMCNNNKHSQLFSGFKVTLVYQHGDKMPITRNQSAISF